MEDNNKATKRKSRLTGKQDISRETTDQIITDQIDRLNEVSRTNNDAATKVRESVGILYEKRIPVETEKFEYLSRHFIVQMEDKLKKVKRPSKGLVWYIVMWSITLLSAFLAGYYIHQTNQWKKDAAYWYQMYEDAEKTIQAQKQLESVKQKR